MWLRVLFRCSNLLEYQGQHLMVLEPLVEVAIFTMCKYWLNSDYACKDDQHYFQQTFQHIFLLWHYNSRLSGQYGPEPHTHRLDLRR